MLSYNEFLDACFNGDLLGIKRYFDQGGNLDKASDSGNTGLRTACVADRVESVKYLLELGADPNKEIWLKSRISDKFICEKGVVLFYSRSEQVVNILKEYGADFSFLDIHGDGVPEWWRKLGREEEFISEYF